MNPQIPASPTETQPTKSPFDLLQEQIRIRAFELYELRGREDGHDLDDWLHAESEIVQQRAKAVAA
jgi:Protein of unknown function (DUF2934)